MPVNFTLREPAGRSLIPSEPFSFNNNGAPSHEIIRLLLGSADVTNKTNSKIIQLRKNLLTNGNLRVRNPVRICEILFEEPVSLEEYGSFSRDLSSRNLEFFEILRNELVLCLVADKNTRHTECFLYLYRILELIAVAFPMLYTSSVVDFRKSFNFLRSLLESDRDKDLAVLGRAIPSIFRGTDLARLSFDIVIRGIEVPWAQEFRNQLHRCKITQGYDVAEDLGEILFSVPMTKMSSFIADTRNRMFHCRASEQNFDLGRLGGSEKICSIVVPPMMAWFAAIYAEMLRVMARRML